MKKRFVPVGLWMCVFLFHGSVMMAQEPAIPSMPQAPVLPMNVKFRFAPQYFEQPLQDDPRYARIVALVSEGRCDVVLLDKTMNREAFYSTLNRKVDALAASGADAYNTAIDFAAYSTADSNPRFQIHFKDQFAQEITWQFVVGEMVAHASPEVLFRTNPSGITLLYAGHRAPSARGTTLTIGERKYSPESTPSNGAVAAFYATDMTIGRILPGVDRWSVDSSPAEVVQSAKWNLSGSGGRKRMLVVQELSDTEAAVEQIDLNDPDAPQVVLKFVRVNDTYGLGTLSYETHGNRLWIFFGPELPLPAGQANENTTVTFTIAENEQATVASGKLEVRRALDAEHLVWRFDAPDLAKGNAFETGVNLVPGDSQLAKCVDGECLKRSPKQE